MAPRFVRRLVEQVVEVLLTKSFAVQDPRLPLRQPLLAGVTVAKRWTSLLPTLFCGGLLFSVGGVIIGQSPFIIVSVTMST